MHQPYHPQKTESHDSSLFSSSDVLSAHISVMLLEPWKEIEVL